jgi:broad specificity phosphatase PhoE
MRSAPATAAHAEGVTLVVAHNAINQALLCSALGVGAQEGFRAIVWPNW